MLFADDREKSRLFCESDYSGVSLQWSPLSCKGPDKLLSLLESIGKLTEFSDGLFWLVAGSSLLRVGELGVETLMGVGGTGGSAVWGSFDLALFLHEILVAQFPLRGGIALNSCFSVQSELNKTEVLFLSHKV